MHRPRHRADRDGHRRRHRHLGDHGNHRRVPHRGHRRHRRRHRGSYRRHLHREDHRDDRRQRRDHEHPGRGEVRRDDRPHLAVRRAGGEACCRGSHPDGVRHLGAGGHPDEAGRLHPGAGAALAVRRAPGWRTGCCRRGVRGLRAWGPDPAADPGWGLRGLQVRWALPGRRLQRELRPRPAAGPAVRRPRARRPGAPVVPAAARVRPAVSARRAVALRAWVPSWWSHRWPTRRRRVPWVRRGPPWGRRAWSRHPMPHGAVARRALRRSRMLI